MLNDAAAPNSYALEDPIYALEDLIAPALVEPIDAGRIELARLDLFHGPRYDLLDRLDGGRIGGRGIRRQIERHRSAGFVPSG